MGFLYGCSPSMSPRGIRPPVSRGFLLTLQHSGFRIVSHEAPLPGYDYTLSHTSIVTSFTFCDIERIEFHSFQSVSITRGRIDYRIVSFSDHVVAMFVFNKGCSNFNHTID